VRRCEHESYLVFVLSKSHVCVSAQDARNRTLAVHELVDSRHLPISLILLADKSNSTDILVYYGLAVIQPIAFEVPFHLIPQSQSDWSLFNGTWQKRGRELDTRLSFDIKEMTLQMQQAIIQQSLVVPREPCVQ